MSTGRRSEGLHIGVDFEVVVFADENGQREHPIRRRTVVLNIRKLNDVPTELEMQSDPPSASVDKVRGRTISIQTSCRSHTPFCHCRYNGVSARVYAVVVEEL